MKKIKGFSKDFDHKPYSFITLLCVFAITILCVFFLIGIIGEFFGALGVFITALFICIGWLVYSIKLGHWDIES